MKTVRGDIILWKPISSSEQRYLGVINKPEDMKSDRYYMKTAVNHYQETLDLSFLSLMQFSPLMAICQTPWPLSSSHSIIHHLFQYLSTVTHTHTHTHSYGVPCLRCGTMPPIESTTWVKVTPSAAATTNQTERGFDTCC